LTWRCGCLTVSRVNRIETKLLALIAESGRPLSSLTKSAGVGYHAVYRWYTGRSSGIDVGTAERLWLERTGESLLPEEEGVEPVEQLPETGTTPASHECGSSAAVGDP